jgi:hypothetical protein
LFTVENPEELAIFGGSEMGDGGAVPSTTGRAFFVFSNGTVLIGGYAACHAFWPLQPSGCSTTEFVPIQEYPLTGIPAGSKIAKIVSNGHNTGVLLEAGKVYMVGEGSEYQLGTLSTDNSTTFVETSLVFCKDIALARYSVTVLCGFDELMDIYTWGYDPFGEAGRGSLVGFLICCGLLWFAVPWALFCFALFVC